MPAHHHCSHCGSAYPDTSSFPRQCSNDACGALTWVNPVPVAVVLVPVRHEAREGLLVVRRAIEPRRGHLAIVGGFVDAEESWQAAAAREVLEETGVTIATSGLAPFWYTSTEPYPNRVLLFSVAEPLVAGDLPRFEPSSETSERGLVFGPEGLAEAFAFPLHVAAAARYFAERGIDGPHDYTEL